MCGEPDDVLRQSAIGASHYAVVCATVLSSSPPNTARVSLLEYMEVLLVYKDSRRQLEVKKRDDVCNVVATALEKIGWHGLVTVLEPEASSVCSVQCSSTTPVYILQRWSERWNAFVDIDRIDEIKDGDKLTVISKPVGSPLKVIFFSAHYIMGIRLYFRAYFL